MGTLPWGLLWPLFPLFSVLVSPHLIEVSFPTQSIWYCSLKLGYQSVHTRAYQGVLFVFFFSYKTHFPFFTEILVVRIKNYFPSLSHFNGWQRQFSWLNDMCKITRLLRKMSQCSKATFVNNTEKPIVSAPMKGESGQVRPTVDDWATREAPWVPQVFQMRSLRLKNCEKLFQGQTNTWCIYVSGK